MGLWLTFLLGIFIILGAIVVFYLKNNEKLIEFSIGLASGVVFMLILTDLIPEVVEAVPYVGIFKVFAILTGVAFGFVFLLVLDKFIPDHEDNPKTHQDDSKNLEHIGIVSAIALCLHNLVEGMAIYMLSLHDIKAAFVACIGVGLHNIPLGMVITSAFYQQNTSKKKTLVILSIVALSTFLGGLLIVVFPAENYISMLEAISLTLTIGMLIFILLMELIPKLKKAESKKCSMSGLILGVVLLLIAMLF